MKKLAIGCGIIVLLLGVAAAAVSYYVYRQIGTTVAQFAELAQAGEIERGVRNRGPYTAPASGELTRDQVERLVRVQGRVRDHLGARFADLEARHRTLLEKEQADALDLPQILAVYRDLASTWLDAKRRQVEALNEVNFSLDEYRWVRERAYAALGVPFVELDITRLMDEAGSWSDGDPDEEQDAFGADDPGANATLVAPFRKRLEENVALASLGL